MAACQGALLLVDSTQGVQAQTLANYRIALEANLSIIPVLTKLDLHHSDPAKALDQIEKAFGFSEDDVIWTSAKSGEGVDEILPALIERVPAPSGYTRLRVHTYSCSAIDVGSLGEGRNADDDARACAENSSTVCRRKRRESCCGW